MKCYVCGEELALTDKVVPVYMVVPTHIPFTEDYRPAVGGMPDYVHLHHLEGESSGAQAS